MASLTQSPHNPFRSPAVTPIPTGTLNSAAASSNVPALGGRGLGTVGNNERATALSASQSLPNVSVTSSTPIEDRYDFEEPPAYTPSPDVHQGETTVEYGPTRAFQPPPQRPPLSPPPSQHQHYLLTQPTGSSQRSGSIWDQLANTLQAQLTNVATSASERGSSLGRLGWSQPSTGGWPSHPSRQHQQYAQSQPSFSPPLGPPPPSSFQNSTNRLVPPLPPRNHVSAPSSPTAPPAPVHRRHSSDFARDFYAVGAVTPPELAAASSSTGNIGNTATRNGKPTTTPIAGHPLLNNGKLLVYPRGHECDKCHNTGYKLPRLKPCKRCWHRYAKPFSGPLAYSFGEASLSNTSANFQRPLQTLPPPPPSLASPPPRPMNPNVYVRPQQLSHPSTAYRSHRTFSPPISNFRSPSIYSERPPPGAIVYNSGDPRIGGRLCWRCNGIGTVTFMLFDREQCPICDGLGRTF